MVNVPASDGLMSVFQLVDAGSDEQQFVRPFATLEMHANRVEERLSQINRDAIVVVGAINDERICSIQTPRLNDLPLVRVVDQVERIGGEVVLQRQVRREHNSLFDRFESQTGLPLSPAPGGRATRMVP